MKQLGTLKFPALAILTAFAAFAGILTPQAHAQGITSSGIKGKVTDETGSGIPGVQITITHVPTGSKQTTETKTGGRYAVRGLAVGGPYTIIAQDIGYGAQGQNNLFLELSRSLVADFELESDETVVELEAFTVTGGDDFLFSSNTAGVGTVFGEDSIMTTPKTNRSFNDIAKFDPRIVMTDATGGAGMIVAAGQNNRQNSIQIDGVKINDQFGLGSDGSPALANPISLDTIQEIAVEIAPYDVRQSGFTGASVNAVTKSGTNQFKGSAYYYFENEDMRGENPTSGQDDVFEENTIGYTLGGPIIKDKLFFFAAYEELERNTAGPTPGFTPDPTVLQSAIDKIENDYGFDPGTFGLPEGSTVALNDEKLLAKIDWNINQNHRASLRWNHTEGTRPDFTEYDDFSSSQPETNLTSHWYTDTRKNDSWVFQMFSSWGENWETEFRWGRSDFDSTPDNPNVFPEIVIDDFPGTTRSGEPTTRGELFFGRDDSRHSNELYSDITNLYLAADYTTGDHTITFGIDQEESEFFNLFLQQTFGEMTFFGTDAFFNDEIGSFRRSVGVEGVPIAAESDFTTTGYFIQDSWDVNEKLNVTYGLRLDKVSTERDIPENPGRNGQTFEEIFGTSNTNTIDGTDLFAPRVSFEYEVSDLTKFTGGLGLYLGRNPWVWVSNAYSNTGINNTDIFSPPSGSDRADGGGLLGYLQNDFDPENPVQFVSQEELGSGRSTIALLAPGFELPSIWKANLNLEHKFGSESPWEAYAELLLTQAKNQIFTSNINLRETGTAPDGRTLFAGSLRTASNGFSEFYNDVYQLNNSSEGESTNLTVGIRRTIKDNWDMDLSYTYGSADDVSNQGSSTAGSNFAGNPVYNQNSGEVGTSVYETKHRVLAMFGYELELKENWATRFNLVYEGKSGQPYSLLFGNDFNQDDADFDNDLFYVPTGMDDPLLDVEGSSGLEEMFAFLESIGAPSGVTPRNGLKTQWRHRVDLNITQEIPMGSRFSGELFLNFLNLGNMFSSGAGIIDEVPFQTLSIADGDITNDGTKIAYDYRGATATSVRTGQYSQLSRWRIQTGFKIKF